MATTTLDPVEPQVLTEGLLSTKTQVESTFRDALKAAFPNFDPSEWEPAITVSNPKFGDYQCNNAMAIFKAHKADFPNCKAPKDIGEIIKNHVNGTLFTEVVVAPQGFVTVRFSNEWLEEQARRIIRDGIHCKTNKALSCIVDYSSPNIAKEMHVGHLRTTIHGEAICRILEFVGHTVSRVNHVGDWGTQFGMLIEHLQEAHPHFETEDVPNLSDLNAFYKESKKRFDSDPEFKDRARKMVVALQGGDARARNAWQMLVKISMNEFQKIYDRLGVDLIVRGESFYNDMLPGIVEVFEKADLITVSDGAKCLFLETEPEKREQEVPLMVQKSDGGFGYDSTDLACIYHRLKLCKANWLIYVTDIGQQDHFFKVFKAAKLMGWHNPPATRAEHVALGLVCGDDGKKFKTRSGEVVKLVTLLDEAARGAEAELKARREGSEEELTPEELEKASRRIGFAAVKYADLKQQRAGNYIFSFERMLDPKGNTAVYLLYAYARICQIVRKAGVDEATLRESELKITEPPERQLLMTMLRFPEVIELILTDFSCHRLCEFMFQLSTTFTEFYSGCRVIGSVEQESRLMLCLVTKKMLAVCFNLLGIEPLERI